MVYITINTRVKLTDNTILDTIMTAIPSVNFQDDLEFNSFMNLIQSNVRQLNERIKQPMETEDENECEICFNEMTEDTMTVLHKRHKFHTECINKWWETQTANNLSHTCPICRAHPDVLPIHMMNVENEVDRMEILRYQFKLFIQRARQSHNYDATVVPSIPYSFKGDHNIEKWIQHNINGRIFITPKPDDIYNRFEPIRVSLEKIRRLVYNSDLNTQNSNKSVTGVLTDDLYAQVDPGGDHLTSVSNVLIYIAVDLSLSLMTNQYPNDKDRVLAFIHRIDLLNWLPIMIRKYKQNYLRHRCFTFLEEICGIVEETFDFY